MSLSRKQESYLRSASHGHIIDYYDGGRGDCFCGKTNVKLTILKFDQPVRIDFYNGKVFEGTMVGMGQDCLGRYEYEGQKLQEAARQGRLREYRQIREQFRL